jgi:predicted outer membrane lipoprotein
MWYFSFGILNAMWFEFREDRRIAKEQGEPLTRINA